MTTISFVASDGENVLWDRLSGLFEGASVLRIASAFVGAHDDILFWVDSDSKRHVEVILRLEFPTNPTSVAALLKHPRVAIRAADPASNMPFHEKLFLAVAADGECIGAYIGSANWTQNGLRKNREAGVWLTERDVLRQIASHFTGEYHAALRISDQMLAKLRSDFLWQTTHGKRPKKDRGTIISSWSNLRAAGDGRFILKQNGVSWNPFVEGRDEFSDLVRNQGSQTFSRIPSTLQPGLGFIVSRIARRQDGSPDRVIYGRGRIAAFDRNRWRLPERYVAELRLRGVDKEKCEYLRRWPEILWLDPAEFIDYPRGFTGLLWLSDYMAPSFQGGFRWISADVWKAINRSLDQHTDKYGVLPLDRQGIWWNEYVGITEPDDPLFMTKARIEEMNCGA